MDFTLQLPLLFLGGILSGIANSIAGGGSFLAFPLLMYTGVPPVLANVTCTLSLYPGTISSACAYLKDWPKEKKIPILWLSLLSIVGSIIGAKFLLRTKDSAFAHMVPYFMLFGTLIFLFAPRMSLWFRSRTQTENNRSIIFLAFLILCQIAVSFYGGYFGGGMGILILCLLSLWGMTHIHQMNAYRTVMVACVNGIAILIFLTQSEILWRQSCAMGFGAIFGGYFGARTARMMNPSYLRMLIASVGITISAYYFLTGP